MTASDRFNIRSVKEKQERRATTCAQSSQPLSEPVVACQLGYLFNKEALLTALVRRSKLDRNRIAR